MEKPIDLTQPISLFREDVDNEDEADVDESDSEEAPARGALKISTSIKQDQKQPPAAKSQISLINAAKQVAIGSAEPGKTAQPDKVSARLKLQKSNSVDLFAKKNERKIGGILQSAWAGASTPKSTKSKGLRIQSTTKMPFRNNNINTRWR